MRKAFVARCLSILVLASFAVSCSSRAETETPKAAVSAAAIVEALTRSAELFGQREDVTKLREAVRTLGAVRNPDGRNYEVEWKFARYSYFLGRQTGDEKERDKAFEDGKLAGRIASRVEPGKPEGYFWFAANLGEQAKLSPVTVGLKAIDDIREAMNKVIEIDPKYQGASAYDALAQIELSTAGMMGGKPEKAVELVEKGLGIEKNNTYLYLRAAEAYLAVGKKAEARKHIDHLLKMPPDPEYLIEYRESVEKAKKMLEARF